MICAFRRPNEASMTHAHASHEHSHDGSGRRYAGLTLDTHAHWYPPEWIALLQRDGAAQGARLERSGAGYRISAGALVNAFSEEFVQLELRLAGMQRQGVDMQALSLTTPMVYWAPPAFGLALSQVFNDAASAAHLKHPRRFVGMAMLPMQDPALALKELERAAKLPGLRGLYLATSIDGTELDDRRYWDIYAKCEELAWPIFLHPVYTIGVDRTTRFYLRNLLGNPYDTGMAAASLVFGGVLDAYPRLEINLPHAGGAFPWLIGRLDHGTRVRPELKHMKRLPSEYLRRFSYDTIGHDDRINLDLARLVGADRMLLGSDYCFDMGLEQPVQAVERLVELSDAERDLILGRTAAKLLGVE
jgi:aminocarboxymuconate-semialdehyde decarboxylase